MRSLFSAAAMVGCILSVVPALAQQPSPEVAPSASPAPADKAPSAEADQAARETPKCNEACVRASTDKASAICARKIEAQAPADFEWITRPFTGIFQQADPSTSGDAIVTYRGDSIRFMSPQKDWVRVSYECAFDVEKSTVAGVRVRPGRLDKPIALQAPPAPNGQPQQPTAPVAAGPLAEAILKAAKQKSEPPPKPLRERVGEPSPIDISQINPRRGSW
ncbi:conserved hypothetical protein [Rhodopseudomonas palustris BisB5]|uniref:Uncharacterized protein n=1 Tax=Rhodopseudomonas palustris (strain BisB5) TaxID=316057 RepID=Q136N4_RHOPS|nr:conserved hypothetical protein [Rhodopseudomonas palustris BisB5]